MTANAEIPHRGRLQAQGGKGRGIEESESWAQNNPLTAVAGHRLLDALYEKLTVADQEVRQTAFTEARIFIEAARRANGIGPIRKSFPKNPNPHKERVDVEVRKGLAFVPGI